MLVGRQDQVRRPKFQQGAVDNGLGIVGMQNMYPPAIDDTQNPPQLAGVQRASGKFKVGQGMLPKV